MKSDIRKVSDIVKKSSLQKILFPAFQGYLLFLENRLYLSLVLHWNKHYVSRVSCPEIPVYTMKDVLRLILKLPATISMMQKFSNI